MNNDNSKEERGSSNPEAEKYGTELMGAPAVPDSHPNNQKAATWNAGDHPPESVQSSREKFNSWSAKAEKTANDIWHNLRTGHSVSESAWGKMNVTAKAITGGGFEQLYKQSFTTLPNEKLKKSFACYLSTTTGPVAGTLYLSNMHVAFCSDRPLSFTAPSGQLSWSYYKVLVPLGKVATVNPVVKSEDRKYIQTTVDGQDFWFMGFVNFDKASHNLLESVSSSAATGIPVQA